MTIEIIKKMFEKCVAQQRFLDEPEIVRTAKNAPDLKEALIKFYKSQKFSDDSQVLFNWFIAVAFGLSLDNLK